LLIKIITPTRSARGGATPSAWHAAGRSAEPLKTQIIVSESLRPGSINQGLIGGWAQRLLQLEVAFNLHVPPQTMMAMMAIASHQLAHVNAAVQVRQTGATQPPAPRPAAPLPSWWTAAAQ
jgi:hypothetical protein